MTKKKSKKKIIAVLFLMALFMTGAAAFIVNAKTEEPPPAKDREYIAERGDITVGIDAEGKLAAKSVPYSVADGTELYKVHAKEGQQVKAGDILAELSVPEAEKNRENYKEIYDGVREALEDAEEEREDYLFSLNWLLENQKDDSYNAYIDRYWELQNEIYDLEASIDEAEYKQEWSDDGDLMETSLKELRAELEAKEAELEKLEADREKQEALESDLDYQKEQQEKKLRVFDEKVDALKKQLEEARQKMEKAGSRYITAEKDGVVLKVNYQDGETAKDGVPVLEIGDNDALTLHLTVDPEDIVDIQEGQEVSFFVEAYPEKTFTGEVTEKNLVPNAEGKYEVYVKVHETDSELFDGMKAGATIIIKQKKDVLTLQNKAIILEDGKQYVQIRNDEGEIEKREITTGFSDGRVSEILSGLNEGDAVIYGGQTNEDDGANQGTVAQHVTE